MTYYVICRLLDDQSIPVYVSGSKMLLLNPDVDDIWLTSSVISMSCSRSCWTWYTSR